MNFNATLQIFMCFVSRRLDATLCSQLTDAGFLALTKVNI